MRVTRARTPGLFAMRRARLAIGLTLAGATWSCRGGATVPRQLDVTGKWAGTETDRLGPGVLTWNLKQDGTVVWGTVSLQPVDSTDGTCASCHKFKVGSVEGTMSGTTLQIQMFFPSGGADRTPICSITLSSMAPMVSATEIAGTYGGSDPCEGTFDGTLSMTRSR